MDREAWRYLTVLINDLPGFVLEVTDSFVLVKFTLDAEVVKRDSSWEVLLRLLSFRKNCFGEV